MSKELMFEVDDTKRGTDDAAKHKSHDGAAASAEVRDASPETSHAPASSYFKPLVLQHVVAANNKDEYHVEELLQYHDGLFIENAYIALLKRAPSDAEHARELDELRGGRASKVEIIERLIGSPEASAAGRVRVEGLPSPVMKRLGRVPLLGYVLRLAGALLRLPVLMQHQQQFEIYVLAQQQIIADYVNQMLTLPVQGDVAATGGDASHPGLSLSQHNDLIETVEMFSDALIDLSNGHAELQVQVETQAGQVQAALTDLTHAMTAQQQITEKIGREQQASAEAQQEFLIQEQRVIVETQKVLLEELREELHALARRQQDARAELDTEVRRLQTLLDAAAPASRESSSDQESKG